MLLRSLLCTVAFTALALGCTASANEPGPSTPAEGAQSGGGANGCAAGATQNSEGAFCLGLPKGSSSTPTAKTEGRYEYATANGTVLVTVKRGDKAAFEAAKNQVVAKSTSFGGHTVANETQLSTVWREQATTAARSSVTLLFVGGKIYECSVTSENADTLKACQTLKAL